jgi:C4-dicarboxylate-specific signal transduction histidine kinase
MMMTKLKILPLVFRDLTIRLMARDQQVAAQNALLENEVAERKHTRKPWSHLNEELEERIIQRTTELTLLNEELLNEINEKNIAKNAFQIKNFQQERLIETAHQLTQS